jgi:two-component sensor histidine kinase
MVARRGADVSRPEPWLATQRATAADPVDEADQLLLDRVRLGMRLVLAGIAVVFVGELLLHSGERPLISLVQAANFVTVAIVLLILRGPPRRALTLAAGFFAYAVTVVSVGAVGIVAGDAMTPVVLFVGLALVTATLLPWSPRWQFFSVVLLVATAIWTVATIVVSPRLFWLQNVGSIAPTLFSTVFLSHTLWRQRDAVARAERERQTREGSLRDANRRLEQEIQEHRRTEDALRFAMRELDHRVKNTLATVQAVADQTLRSTQSMPEFSEAFHGRVQAMARIHTALAGHRLEGLKVSELIELAVGPYRHHADSVLIECDGSFVSSELVRVLGMALHELATNAAKYGALSTKEGRVAISSRLAPAGTSPLRIEWSEHNGPRVSEPTHRGFGLRLIEEAVAYEAGGSVKLQFPGQGLHCEIEIPVPPVQL